MRRAEALQRAIDQDFDGLVFPIEDRQLDVENLLDPTNTCIVLVGDVDFRATATEPEFEVVPHSYVLQAVSDEDPANPTGWAFSRSTALVEDREPFDPGEVCR